MRTVAFVLACVAISLTTAGCDPGTERRYFTEGAGVDLYTADRERQINLQRQYINFVCDQANIACPPGNWTTFVLAGMNDIDLRCDGFLTWLDARRRDREPVLAEINAISTATHAIMTVTGVSPKSLDIVAAAFGLASATYTNWNSRLLISVNQSTVQTVVYSRQSDFRKAINSIVVPDQPTAIYYLRSYLRICLPTTIEAEINTMPTLVQRGDPLDVNMNPVVNPVRPAVIRNVNFPMQRLSRIQPTVGPTRLSDFESKLMLPSDMRMVLDTLCRSKSEKDLGPAGSPARLALAKFLKDNGRDPVEVLDRNTFLEMQDLNKAKKRAC